MTLHKTLRVPTALALTIFLLALSAAPMFAAAPTKAERLTSDVISPSPDGAIVLVPRRDLPNKAAWTPEADVAPLAEPAVQAIGCLPCTTTLANSAFRSVTPPGGAAGNIHATYSSTVTYGGNIYSLSGAVAGTSQTAWFGTNPYNASQIGLIDTFNITGISISLSVPWGIGVSINGNGWTYNPGNAFNRWALAHDWSGQPATFSGAGLLNITESAQGNFLLGGTWYPISAPATTAWF